MSLKEFAYRFFPQPQSLSSNIFVDNKPPKTTVYLPSLLIDGPLFYFLRWHTTLKCLFKTHLLTLFDANTYLNIQLKQQPEMTFICNGLLLMFSAGYLHIVQLNTQKHLNSSINLKNYVAPLQCRALQTGFEIRYLTENSIQIQNYSKNIELLSQNSLEIEQHTYVVCLEDIILLFINNQQYIVINKENIITMKLANWKLIQKPLVKKYQQFIGIGNNGHIQLIFQNQRQKYQSLVVIYLQKPIIVDFQINNEGICYVCKQSARKPQEGYFVQHQSYYVSNKINLIDEKSFVQFSQTQNPNFVVRKQCLSQISRVQEQKSQLFIQANKMDNIDIEPQKSLQITPQAYTYCAKDTLTQQVELKQVQRCKWCYQYEDAKNFYDNYIKKGQYFQYFSEAKKCYFLKDIENQERFITKKLNMNFFLTYFNDFLKYQTSSMLRHRQHIWLCKQQRELDSQIIQVFLFCQWLCSNCPRLIQNIFYSIKQIHLVKKIINACQIIFNSLLFDPQKQTFNNNKQTRNIFYQLIAENTTNQERSTLLTQLHSRNLLSFDLLFKFSSNLPLQNNSEDAQWTIHLLSLGRNLQIQIKNQQILPLRLHLLMLEHGYKIPQITNIMVPETQKKLLAGMRQKIQPCALLYSLKKELQVYCALFKVKCIQGFRNKQMYEQNQSLNYGVNKTKNIYKNELSDLLWEIKYKLDLFREQYLQIYLSKSQDNASPYEMTFDQLMLEDVMLLDRNLCKEWVQLLRSTFTDTKFYQYYCEDALLYCMLKRVKQQKILNKMFLVNGTKFTHKQIKNIIKSNYNLFLLWRNDQWYCQEENQKQITQ